VTSEIHSQSDEADRAAMPPDGRIDLRELALGPSKRPDRVSMREKILAEALKLFLEKGYTATSLEEIGAAAGITAAGTYRHFRNKQEILVDALELSWSRVLEGVRLSLTLPPESALVLLVNHYTALTVDDGAYLILWVAEQHHLPEEWRRRFRRIQRLYIEEWVHLLNQLRPDLTDDEARMHASAALSVTHTRVLYGSGLDRDATVRLLSSLALQLLLEAPRQTH
jgi:AcrR family transcriptional regulator